MPNVAGDESEQPIIITSGPNKGKDLTGVKHKNAFLLVRQALKMLYSRQELIEGMLSPRKEQSLAGDATTPELSHFKDIDSVRKDLSPSRKKCLKGLNILV